jgi:predicted RNA binding protein YcfA (HicA-like mRNA interferase family)
MPAIRPVPYQELEKFLLYVGCVFKRQKGSHRVYWRDGLLRPIILPAYQAVPVFIIKNILKQLGIPAEEYLRIMSDL